MAIHETDNGSFVVSAYECWIPGSFETRRAARYAYRFSPSDQSKMWKDWMRLHPIPCPNLTFEDMQEWKKTGHFLSKSKTA